MEERRGELGLAVIRANQPGEAIAITARAPPQILGLFAASQQLGGIVPIHFLRRRLASPGNSVAETINALAPRNGEKPGGERAAGIKLGDGLKCPDKCVLRHFARIGVVPAGLEDKRVNTIFVAADQFLKRDEVPSLALPG